MEIFAYIMAGIMVITTALSWVFKLKLDKWSVIKQANVYSTNKTVIYGGLIEICRMLVVLEVIILFLGAVVCGIIKALS